MTAAARKQTPAQGLHQLRQESLRLLFNFAESTQQVARHQWADKTKRERATVLVSCIKRDLEAYKTRLDTLVSKTSKLPGKVLAHPHHPELLQVGGQYLSFIDDVTSVIAPMMGELSELIIDDVETLKQPATAAAL